MSRLEKDGSKWLPKPSDRVCSDHFIDKIPTEAHPDPTLHLGYDVPVTTPRGALFRQSCSGRKRLFKLIVHQYQFHLWLIYSISQPSSSTEPALSDYGPVLDHSYSLPAGVQLCPGCVDKNDVIDSLSKKVSLLKIDNQQLKREKILAATSKSVSSWRKIKSDAKMNFYTGLSSNQVFNTVFSLIEPILPQVRYWRGTNRITSTKVRTISRSKLKKLCCKDEFLLRRLRIRFGILNEDLADRFGISPTVCSNTFKTWIRLLRIVLGDSLVQWLPIEAVREHLPEVYQKAGQHRLKCIIDCTEVFIERPKKLEVQAQTWSDYKSHNTVKFLIGISPTGFVTFLSDCYSGRASDKYICNSSGFFDLLERDDEVMADRGFQIREEHLLRFCKLSIPPGARTKAQMTTPECIKTKHIANLRIHVEHSHKMC